MRLGLVTAAVIVVVAGGFTVFMLTRPSPSPTQKTFQSAEKQVGFPLLYPVGLPSYFFLDQGTINVSNGIVQFSIVQDGGQKIYVTEQSLPANFSLKGITGTVATKPGIGTLVIGSGFLGYRAVIKGSQTLVVLTCSTSINGNDFATVVKDLRLVNKSSLF
jgi:hypothetical protein